MNQKKAEEFIILSSAPPLAVHLAAMALAAVSRRVWIADFRDPISSMSSFSRGDALFQGVFASWLERLVLKKASLVLANTDVMHQTWSGRYPALEGKIHTLWNGFDPEDVISTFAPPERSLKVLSHIGELYDGRTIRPVVGALQRLLEGGRVPAGSVILRQVGAAESAELPDPQTLRAAQAAGWLEIKDPVPAKDARSLALDSDGLLLLQPHTAIQVPAKLFEYLRLGRPIFAYIVRDSPAERILLGAGVPFQCIYPEDTPEAMERGILQFIQRMGGKPASYNSWFAETFDASRQAASLDTLIRSLMA